MGIYDWDYSKYTVALSVAVEQKNTEKTKELLKIMLASLERPVDLTSSVLYTHLRRAEEFDKSAEQKNAAMNDRMGIAKQMREGLLAAIKDDEQFAFLRKK